MGVRLRSGALELVKRHPNSNPKRMVEDLFMHALGRNPTPQETSALLENYNKEQQAKTVEDWFWAVCMMPEFMVVR